MAQPNCSGFFVILGNTPLTVTNSASAARRYATRTARNHPEQIVGVATYKLIGTFKNTIDFKLVKHHGKD